MQTPEPGLPARWSLLCRVLASARNVILSFLIDVWPGDWSKLEPSVLTAVRREEFRIHLLLLIVKYIEH